MQSDHLAHMLLATAARVPERPALVTPHPDGSPAGTTTYAELVERARRGAAALVERGVARGDRVAIFSANRPGWTLADAACLMAGAVSVPLYPTSTPAQVTAIGADAGIVLAVVDGATALERTLEAASGIPTLREVVVMDDVDLPATSTVRVSRLADVLAGPAAPAAAAEVDDRLATAAGDDIATIVYTSGTTGRPKGAVLQHKAFLHELRGLAELFDVGPQDTSLAFLPLSHALERGWSYFVYYRGATNVFVGNPKDVAGLLRAVRPSTLVSVPKLYEMVYAGAHEKAASSPVTQRIFDWALRVGGEAGRYRLEGRPLPRALAARLAVADRLVLHNVRDAIGGRKEVLACGGAPLRREVEDFFWAAGALVHTGYGLTEAAPLISFNSSHAFRFGTAGRVLAGGALRIADDGEIQYRGDNVMAGYWNDPAATAEVMTDDGWLRTGDIGTIDDDGYLRITDRLKDIVVTLQGKNIAPAPIESLLTADPLVENAVVLGDDRPCLVALVEPAPGPLETWARENGIDGDVDRLREDPRVVAELSRRVEAACAGLPSHEVVRGTAVLPHAPTIDNGLMTPTLKVRRRAVEETFRDVVDGLYEQVAARRHGG